MTASGLIVAAARSGSGKTSVTLGLLRAFAETGLRVVGVKSGPDYIDPAFHAAASGRPGVNLDTWAMPPPLVAQLAAEAAGDADLVIVESAMGLFDGIAGAPGRSGSAADLARAFGWPVLLVLDVSGQSQTAAAVAHGLASFDPGVTVAGVVLNRVGSARHRALCTEAIVARGLPVVGSILRDPTLTLPERHLGLVQAGEHPDLAAHLDWLRDAIKAGVDLAAVRALARPMPHAGDAAAALPPPGQRIALAQDAAFSFVYPHVVAGWRRAGAELVAFSPLADAAPPDDCDCCWLPGGYPELHAGQLAAAPRFRTGLQAFAATRPVHGECGGFMVLGRSIADADGVEHPMLGLLDHRTSFAKRRMTLGYREARWREAGVFGAAAVRVRGHEFRYAVVVDAGTDEPLVDLFDGTGQSLGPAGGRRGPVSGTFFHAIATQ